MNKNVWLLFASNAFAFSVAPVTVFLSGIIGTNISPIKSLSTLPMSLSIVGTAIFIIAASKIMSITGRKKGFIFSSITTSLFALLAAYSVLKQNFILYSFSCFCLGFGMAFAHQYRFAAAESVDKKQAPKAISLLLFAGILSALLGPNLANFGKNIISDGLYVGSYLCLSLLTLSSIIFLIFYKENKIINNKKNLKGRTILELISQPRFLQALVSSSFAYAVMSFLMTATPISMHIHDDMTLNSTSFVIQFHIISMFLPALITGNLIKKYGHSKIMHFGVLFFIFTIMLSYFDQTVINYLFSLAFLGLGWNFLFISGTSLLVLNYKEEERFKAQGFNDFIVFSIQATASLTAGIVLSFTSWKIMNILCIPFLIIIIFTTLRADRLLNKTN
ncbi:MFS transporter [Candidatus Pelagibacter sp.]|nr:MFS transporter [Candidatus Pelagibacter sp.]